MAFKKVQSVDSEISTALGGTDKKTGKANPTKAEGYFLGSKEVDSEYSKNGKAFLHILQTAAGNLGVWGKTDLDRQIKNVAPGTMVRITMTGKQKLPGKNDMYKFLVEVDDENTIDVIAAASEPEYCPLDTSADEVEETSLDDTQANEIAPPRTANQNSRRPAPNATQQAAARGLLSARK